MARRRTQTRDQIFKRAHTIVRGLIGFARGQNC